MHGFFVSGKILIQIRSPGFQPKNMYHYRREATLMSSLTEPTFALNKQIKNDSALSAAWWTTYIIWTVQTKNIPLPHYFSIPPPGALVSFEYVFQFSRANVGSIEDDSGVPSLLHITIHVAALYSTTVLTFVHHCWWDLHRYPTPQWNP